jgi:dUTP pyrophosphatase
MRPRLGVLRLPHADGLPLPSYETAGSAGMDLVAAVEEASPILLGSGERCLVPTGLIIQLPEGYEAQVRPRSGLALKHGVTVLNAPGTVDEDYRGEVRVLLINHGTETFRISRGMRIAQMVICRVALVDLHEMDVVSDTVRGAGGFGSTGTGRRKDDRP